MSDVVLRLDGIGKRYRLRADAPRVRYRTMRDEVARLPRLLWRALRDTPAMADDFWALRDVSFEVRQGEVVGLIGRNGAGKSTLLKVLSRIVAPTTGVADVYGRLGSLLEVGTGFHPELTGRENIFLSGAILGMRRSEVKRQLEAIVEFAQVSQFLDLPCKHYSSGMYMRLGFAVAAHLDSEILVVDEVLAVGDAEFQRRCLARIGEVAGAGRTTILVTHHMNVLSTVAHRALLLAEGRVVADGSPDLVARQYLTMGSAEKAHSGCSLEGDGLMIRSVLVTDSNQEPRKWFHNEDEIVIHVDYEVREPLLDLRIVLQFRYRLGDVAFTSTDHSLRRNLVRVEPGAYRSTCRLPGGLLNLGRYAIVLWAGVPGNRQLIVPSECAEIHIEGAGNHGSGYGDASDWPGVICPRLSWMLRKTE